MENKLHKVSNVRLTILDKYKAKCDLYVSQ